MNETWVVAAQTTQSIDAIAQEANAPVDVIRSLMSTGGAGKCTPQAPITEAPSTAPASSTMPNALVGDWVGFDGSAKITPDGSVALKYYDRSDPSGASDVTVNLKFMDSTGALSRATVVSSTDSTVGKGIIFTLDTGVAHQLTIRGTTRVLDVFHLCDSIGQQDNECGGM